MMAASREPEPQASPPGVLGISRYGHDNTSPGLHLDAGTPLAHPCVDAHIAPVLSPQPRAVFRSDGGRPARL